MKTPSLIFICQLIAIGSLPLGTGSVLPASVVYQIGSDHVYQRSNVEELEGKITDLSPALGSFLTDTERLKHRFDNELELSEKLFAISALLDTASTLYTGLPDDEKANLISIFFEMPEVCQPYCTMSEEKHQATIKQKQDADDQESLIRLEEGLAYIRDLNWAESLLLTCQNPVSPSGRIPQSDCKDLEDGLDELKAFHCPWPDPRSPDQDKALSELYEKLCHDLFTNGEAEICQPNCKKVTKEDIEEAIQQAKEAKNEERFEDFKAMLAYVEATMHAESLLNLCLQPEEIQESFLGPRWQWGSCAYFQDSLNAAKAIYDPLYRFHSPAASTETSDP